MIADLRSPGEAALAADLDRLRALPGIRGIEVVRALALVRDAYRPRPGTPGGQHRRLDRVLISGLERDGRMTYAELAALAGLSAAATRSRVLRLIRGGAVHVTVLVDARHTGRLARAGLGITVRGPARDVAEQVAVLPDITYVLTGTGRFDVIAAADTSSETSLLRTIEQHQGTARGEPGTELAASADRQGKLSPDNPAGQAEPALRGDRTATALAGPGGRPSSRCKAGLRGCQGPDTVARR